MTACDVVTTKATRCKRPALYVVSPNSSVDFSLCKSHHRQARKSRVIAINRDTRITYDLRLAAPKSSVWIAQAMGWVEELVQ